MEKQTLRSELEKTLNVDQKLLRKRVELLETQLVSSKNAAQHAVFVAESRLNAAETENLTEKAERARLEEEILPDLSRTAALSVCELETLRMRHEAEKSALYGKLEKSEDVMGTLQAEICDLRLKTEGKEKQRERQASEFSVRLAKKDEELARVQDQKNAQAASCRELSSQFTKFKREHLPEFARQQKQVAGMKERLDTLRKKNATLEEQEGFWKSSIQALKDKSEGLATELRQRLAAERDLEAKNRSIEKSRLMLLEELAQKGNSIEEGRDAIAKLESEIRRICKVEEETSRCL